MNRSYDVVLISNFIPILKQANEFEVSRPRLFIGIALIMEISFVDGDEKPCSFLQAGQRRMNVPEADGGCTKKSLYFARY